MPIPRVYRLFPFGCLAVCLLVSAFAPRASGQALEQSEHGRFVINTLEAPGGNTTYKGVIVRLGKEGEAAVCFDTESLRMSCGWVRGKADGAPADAGGGWLSLIDPRNSTSFTAFHGGPPKVGVFTNKKPEKGKEKEFEAQAAETVKGMMRFATKRGPGWAKGDDLNDPRQAPSFSPGQHLGPLPKDWGHWKGLYRHGEQVVFSYTIGDCDVLETPGVIGYDGYPVFTRTIRLGPSDKSAALVVADLEAVVCGTTGFGGETDTTNSNVWSVDLGSGDQAQSIVWSIAEAPAKSRLKRDGTRLLATFPPHEQPVVFRVAVWTGPKADRDRVMDGLHQSPGAVKFVDPATLTKGGPAQWGDPIETKGVVNASGKPDDAYVVDTLTAPSNNPWKALTRFAGFDFFADGKRAALSTIGGDVWVVSGIDETLEHLKWKRFATGLFQPLGLKVVDDQIYTIGRDGLTKLVDLDGDGEADFYQNVNNDAQVTTNYHEFCLDLQTDAAGNFYYAKGSPWPPDVRSDNQGTMIRVSKDGSKFETFATGLRAPNGSGMGPGDLLVCSDNQGHWMPACKVNRVQEGKFYGMVPAAHLPKGSKEPTTFEPPILWLPMKMDNSSGGEAFAPAKGKWGPLDGHMVHLSYGMSSLFAVSTEEVDGVMQCAAVQFPLKFDSSLMRARFNPTDGQLYVAGLKGWQTNAGREGALHRVRYTGKPSRMPVEFHAHKNGLAITFASPLDKATAADAGNWGVEQWNYKWTGNYGSPEFSAADPTKAKHDDVDVKSAALSADGRTVFLAIDDVKPVMQMHVKCNVKDATGTVVKWDVYNTINKVGPEYKAVVATGR